MADVVINILEEAVTHDLISLADCKTMLDIDATDVTGDPQLQMLISQNSESIAWQCNRIFAKEKVEETWRCVAPVCCPDGTCKIWLSHYPVALDGIESIESPIGTLVDPADYVIESKTGKLIVFSNWSSEIVVTYTGGYDLPDQAPKPLQQVAGLMVRSFRTEAAAAATSGSGIRMIGHKESRIVYFSPKDMAGGSATTSSATTETTAVRSILSKFTRYFI